MWHWCVFGRRARSDFGPVSACCCCYDGLMMVCRLTLLACELLELVFGRVEVDLLIGRQDV